jgi:hypothetical protein
MKLKSLLLASLSLLSYVALCQSTPGVYPTAVTDPYLCTHTKNAIPVNISGQFNDDNRFFVEIRLKDGSRPLLGVYEAALENNRLVFFISDEIEMTSNLIDYRITTTSPATQTTYYQTNFYTRGQITITRPPGESDTLNTGMGLSWNISNSANNTVTVTLNDSSILGLSERQQAFGMVALTSQEIFFVKAINSCQVPVPFSGRLSLVVNPITIIPVKVNNQTALCEGNEIEVKYAVSGGAIPETATFKLRFFDPYPGPDGRPVFEVPATRKSDGVVVARVPEKIVSYSHSFDVAILVDKPALVSTYLKYVTIHQKPVATFNTERGVVPIGQEFSMRLNVSGPRPYTVELSNGASYTLDNNLNITVYSFQTETFSIRSLRTACGITTDLPKQTLVANVPPGIAINSPRGQQWTVCENQKLRLPFVTNAVLTADTKFIVEGFGYNTPVYSFDAKVVNDSVEFLIPHSPAEWGAQGYFNIKRFRIRTTSPSLLSPDKTGFNIHGIPHLTYRTIGPHILSQPQYMDFEIHVSGGIPYSVIDDKGWRTPFGYVPMISKMFIQNTGGYGPKSIENACYSNSDLGKVNLTVNPYTSQAPTIVIHPPAQKYFCDPDSVEVYFEALGKFEEGNQFQIITQLGIALTVSEAGRHKLPVSKLREFAYDFIQVKSTRPVIHVTVSIPFILDKKTSPQGSVDYLGATAERPIIFQENERPYIHTPMSIHSPCTAVYNDGQHNFDFKPVSQYDYFYPVLPKNKVTSYTLKSVTNACGTTEMNRPQYFYWIGYTLSMKYFASGLPYCTGEELVVPFNVERGSVPAGTAFHLQIGRGSDAYTTVASQMTFDDFKYTIPESMEGEYLVRIITDGVAFTEGVKFTVNKTPSAKLSAGGQSSVEIGFGSQITMNYTLTGGGPWELLMREQSHLTATFSPFTRWFQPAKGGVYELRSVSNHCGYGFVSGSVNVRVRPQIVTFYPEKTSACVGGDIRVVYQVGGDIPPGEKIGFYLRSANGTRYELSSVTAIKGTVLLRIPENTPGDWFELFCYISGTEIALSRQINIYKTTDVQLIGSTVINPGESTYINISATNAGYGSTEITLSDGTKSNVGQLKVGSYQFVSVSPLTTTTYTITSATGVCGAGKTSGSVTVTVNPPAARTTRIFNLSKVSPFCEADTLSVFYSTTGTFSPGNQFVVEYYGSNGKVVRAIPVVGNGSPLRIVIPAGFSTTELYRVRLTASDPNTASSDYRQVAQFGTKASAAFANSTILLDDKGISKAVVLLTGTSPWHYTYGNDVGSRQRYAPVNPDTLIITSNEPSVYFKLLSVTNGCGKGTVSEPSIIRVDAILGREEPGQSAEPMTFGPNPTRNAIRLHFDSSAKRTFILYDTRGVQIWEKTVSEPDPEVDMQQYPTGIYLLKISHAKGEQTLKIVKE